MASKLQKSFSEFKQKVSRTLHNSVSSDKYKITPGSDLIEEETRPPTINMSAGNQTKAREEAKIDGMDDLCLLMSDEQPLGAAETAHLVDIQDEEPKKL